MGLEHLHQPLGVRDAVERGPEIGALDQLGGHAVVGRHLQAAARPIGHHEGDGDAAGQHRFEDRAAPGHQHGEPPSVGRAHASVSPAEGEGIVTVRERQRKRGLS